MKAVALVLFLTNALSAGVPEALQAISSVGVEGAGNEAATAAWHVVVEAGPAALPAIVSTAGKGSAVADNWLRLAGDAIISTARVQNRTLPIAELERALLDAGGRPAARILASDLLLQAAPIRAGLLVPALLNDPVQELRRRPVQRLIDTAKGAPPDGARAIYRQALEAVRDEDQTKFLADELKKLGAPVDLRRHFGFLTKWQVIGPFDNTGNKGFATAFPPESEVRFDGVYEGKGKPVNWLSLETADEMGKVDLNKPMGMLKESTAYAATTFYSGTDRTAELRLGTKNAWKVWLNGTLLFSRDEYHRGQQMDQYTMRCQLNKGANLILVKACQNEQTEMWTVEWEFQLRVCDSAGTAIHSEAEVAAGF